MQRRKSLKLREQQPMGWRETWPLASNIPCKRRLEQVMRSLIRCMETDHVSALLMEGRQATTPMRKEQRSQWTCISIAQESRRLREKQDQHSVIAQGPITIASTGTFHTEARVQQYWTRSVVLLQLCRSLWIFSVERSKPSMIRSIHARRSLVKAWNKPQLSPLSSFQCY